jgi:hypothetical protein
MARSAHSSLAQAHGSILPCDSGIAVILARADAADRITIFLTTTSLEAHCPVCGTPSRQVHSRYHRHLDDLPLAGVAVRLDIRARRFRCAHPDCARCTFVEPLPASIGARHARRSSRLAGEQRSIGLVLGGEAGSRPKWCLHMGASPDTLLRLIRQLPLVAHVCAGH